MMALVIIKLGINQSGAHEHQQQPAPRVKRARRQRILKPGVLEPAPRRIRRQVISELKLKKATGA
jgi:hypothetical protein